MYGKGRDRLMMKGLGFVTFESVSDCRFAFERFRADGSMLASASSDHTVRIWNVESQDQHPVQTIHNGCKVPPQLKCAFRGKFFLFGRVIRRRWSLQLSCT